MPQLTAKDASSKALSLSMDFVAATIAAYATDTTATDTMVACLLRLSFANEKSYTLINDLEAELLKRLNS